MYIPEYPNYDWQVVTSGDPWNLMNRWDDMRQYYSEGDQGIVRMTLRAPIPEETVQWLDGLLHSMCDGISGAVRQIGNVLHIPFVVGAWPAIAAVFLFGGAGLILAMTVFVEVLRGTIREFGPEIVQLTTMVFLGLAALIILSR